MNRYSAWNVPWWIAAFAWGYFAPSTFVFFTGLLVLLIVQGIGNYFFFSR